VIISRIDDIGTFAAALALLILGKPSGKIGDDFATLRADQFVFILHKKVFIFLTRRMMDSRPQKYNKFRMSMARKIMFLSKGIRIPHIFTFPPPAVSSRAPETMYNV
jgi:hypothetical protein